MEIREREYIGSASKCRPLQVGCSILQTSLPVILANNGAAADTIRILVATDSHVGYEERDPIRKDDSWKSFHEVMCLAKSEDVSIYYSASIGVSFQTLF